MFVQWVGHEEYGEYLNEGLIRGNGDLLMSALDVSGRKSFHGPGWEVGFSGGIRLKRHSVKVN